MCMQVIAENIEQVEAFGDIPDNVKRGIARILSRRRQINKNTMNLFIGPEEHSVELFDCARLDSDALSQIGYMSMNLRILNLSDCGQMTDSALSIFADTCKHLTSLTLKGPFLVTDGAFANLFSRLETRLEEVYLENAAKLADKGLNALVEMCMRGGDGGGDGKGEERVLRRLGLNHCQSVTDGALKHLCRLGGVGCDAPANGEGEPGPEAGDDDEAGVGARLESLELGHLGGTSDAAIVELLAAVGPGLRKLFLIGFPEMTDSVLQTGIAPHCPRLDTLSLAHDESLSDAGLVAFFNAWHDTRRRHPGARLARLDLTRVVNLGDAALTTVAQLHGADLESLSINSLDDLTGDALRSLAAAVGGGGGGGGRLRELDVSFVRACDDDVFAALAAASAMLERVAVYGCNRLTEVALGGVGGVRNAAGRAVRVVGTEFA
ncbi:hypothetical protein DFJ73DRAFT_842873 [Zopfochytrium polystomum]|nr:hypothetical protein DFJ73DRAFT_842873 [Zopfochytrium polystomum]